MTTEGRGSETGVGCAVPDCDGKRYCKGFCQKHYARWRKHGTAQLQPVASLTERFWSKVAKREEGCWNWTASTRNGYGCLRDQDRTEYAHRLSYIWHFGEIAEGLVIRHRCDNRLCVRPSHLEVGTKADNSRDMVERGRSPRNAVADNGQCANGHPYDEVNTYWWNGSRQCKTCKADWDRRRRSGTGATAVSRRAGQLDARYDRDEG